MKAIKLLLPLVLLVISFSATAQEKSTAVDKTQESNMPPQEPKKQLNLTLEQQTPYREIIKRYAELSRDVRKSALKPDEKKAKLVALDREREAEIKTLLTAEQYKTHLELVELRRSRIIDMRKKEAPVPGSVKAK